MHSTNSQKLNYLKNILCNNCLAGIPIIISKLLTCQQIILAWLSNQWQFTLQYLVFVFFCDKSVHRVKIKDRRSSCLYLCFLEIGWRLHSAFIVLLTTESALQSSSFFNTYSYMFYIIANHCTTNYSNTQIHPHTGDLHTCSSSVQLMSLICSHILLSFQRKLQASSKLTKTRY